MRAVSITAASKITVMTKHSEARGESLPFQPWTQGCPDLFHVFVSATINMVNRQKFVARFSAACAFIAIMRQHFFAQAVIAVKKFCAILWLISPTSHHLSPITAALRFRFCSLIFTQTSFLFGPCDRVTPALAPVVAHVIAMGCPILINRPTPRARPSLLWSHVALAAQALTVYWHITFYHVTSTACDG